jgi:diaminopimelate epimerase
MTQLHLTKHHGLGNDFLVLIDVDGLYPVDADLARAVCDRRRGVGADGLVRVSRGAGGAAVTMELLNSDGSRAEVSGNGLRCVAQAVVEAGITGASRFVVATASGDREVEILDRRGPLAIVSVDMGTVTLQAPPADLHHDLPPKSVALASTGNPHLVLHMADFGDLELDRLGAAYQTQFPATGGINVEYIVTGERADHIDLAVYERGAGVTQACGSGACAAAAAARHWGLTGDSVSVSMPGGVVGVHLDGDAATLVGPAVRVAAVDVDTQALAGREAPA